MNKFCVGSKVAVAALLLLTCLGALDMANAADAGETNALHVIKVHYPELDRIWPTDLSLACNPTIPIGVFCSSGHVVGLSFVKDRITELPGTTPLGNISGLQYLRELYFQEIPTRSYDAWTSQLPSLEALTIRTQPGHVLADTFTADFTNNPRLASLTIEDLTVPTATKPVPPVFTHALILGSQLGTLELSSYSTNFWPSNFLQNVHSLRSLRMIAESGPAFPEFGSDLAPSLTTLSITSPNLATLPTHLGSMVNLQQLIVRGSPAITKLPSGISSFTQLLTLSVQSLKLDLADSIPSLSNLQDLGGVTFKNSSIRTFPTTICSLNPAINLSIDLSFNPLTSIPSCMTDLKVKYWNLDDTKLTSLPERLFSYSGLTQFSMSRVRSLGESSAVLPPMVEMPELQTLRMPDCGLAAPFPSTVGASLAMEEFEMSGNRLTGTLPADLFLKSAKWKTFEVTGSSLEGDFPSPISGATSCTLERLLAGRNKFTSFPDTILNCYALTHLEMGDNENATVPRPLEAYGTPLSYLQHLNVANLPFLTEEISTLPTFYSEAQTRLVSFNVSGCGFTGALWPVRSYTFTTLDVSHNQLKGPLDAVLGAPYYLETLDISNNLFQGTIPSALSSTMSIRSFKASNNLFTGSIPTPALMTTTLWVDGNNLTLCPIHVDLKDRPSKFDSCRISIHSGQPIDQNEAQCWDSYRNIGCTLIAPPSPPVTTNPADTSSSSPSAHLVTTFTLLLGLAALLLA